MADLTPEAALTPAEPVVASAPTAQPMDFTALAAEVTRDYTAWRERRRPFEGGWFVNGAMLRGQQYAQYDDVQGQVSTPVVPSYRIRLVINRIRPKVKARLAKFFKARPKPVVIAASAERKSILNARATEKVLTYQWYRCHLEEKYKDARLWATIGAKGFWWFRFNGDTPAQVRTTDPTTGRTQDVSAPVGDIEIEVGSPFEVLVADETIPRIGAQPKIIRVRMQAIKDVKRRYPELDVEKLQTGDRLAYFKDRLALLNRREGGAMTGTPTPTNADQVLVIEHFIAPCAEYAKGRYVVMIADTVVKAVPELPFELYDHPDNPYPCVEFADSLTPGQFWGTTLVEQLIDLQREYNFIRSLVSENLRMVGRPKIVVFRQHQLAEGAWTNQAGEIVELNWLPNLPPPMIIQAQNIAGDAWNLLALISREFDDLSQVYPAAEGRTSGTNSGFQVNLLQEATDSVHAPDIREDELAIQEAAWKIRRLMKLGYTEQRLVTILGENASPEIFEFSQDSIDEFAEVRIQAGSMLPDLKAARSQVVMQMYQAGMFGDPTDPVVRRRALDAVDMGGLDVMQQYERLDLDEAENENMTLARGGEIKPAQAFQTHPIHISVHQAEFKTPEFGALDPLVQQAKFAHWITHYDWVNPPLAMALRQQYDVPMLPLATPPPPPEPPMVPPALPGVNMPGPPPPTGGQAPSGGSAPRSSGLPPQARPTSAPPSGGANGPSGPAAAPAPSNLP